MTPSPPTRGAEVWAVARLFLRLGGTAFGGPAAHVAIIEDEVVRRRGWLTRQEFLDLLGATQLIPGPNSTEMAIHIGHRRAGWPGLAVGGISFILPSTILVTALAWGYVRFGALPEVAAVLYGIKPVLLTIVAQALWGLGRTAIKNRLLAVLAGVGTALSYAGVNELVLLLATGLVVMSVRAVHQPRVPPATLLIPWVGPGAGVPLAAVMTTGGAAAVPFSLGTMFLFFLKVGAVLFGSGYVLLAFLRGDLVERWGWLTDAQLLDAIAVGQITPGPLFSTATFIGYLLGGPWGALLATVGIFLPAFVFVAISGPLIPRLRASPLAGAFLDGVNAASLAVMAAVTAHLASAAVHDMPTALLAIGGAVLLFKFRLNSTWLVLAGAAAGLIVRVSIHP